MIANPFRSPSLGLPACILTTLAILAYHSGWFWFVALCLAIAAAPWFAASRLLDRIGELEDDNGRLSRELDAERTVRRQTEKAFAEFQVAVADGKVRRGRLHVVPEQRSDSWLEQIMDEQERTWNERHGDGGA